MQAGGLGTMQAGGLGTAQAGGLHTAQAGGLRTAQAGGLCTMQAGELRTAQAGGLCTTQAVELLTAQAGGLLTAQAGGLCTTQAGGLCTMQHHQNNPRTGSKTSHSQPGCFVCCIQQKAPFPQLCEVPLRASRAAMLTPSSKCPAHAWPAHSRHWQLYADFHRPAGRCSRGLSACSGPPGSHRQLRLSFQQRKHAIGLCRKAGEPRWAGGLCWVHEKH